MTILEYLDRIDYICKTEFVSVTELIHDLGISYNTLMRIRLNPDTSSMKTRKKIKKYVDDYHAKNMSVIN